MNLNRVNTQAKPAISDRLTETLPPYFRITELETSISSKGNSVMTAQLSHLRAEIKVMYQMQCQQLNVMMGRLSTDY